MNYVRCDTFKRRRKPQQIVYNTHFPSRLWTQKHFILVVVIWTITTRTKQNQQNNKTVESRWYLWSLYQSPWKQLDSLSVAIDAGEHSIWDSFRAFKLDFIQSKFDQRTRFMLMSEPGSSGRRWPNHSLELLWIRLRPFLKFFADFSWQKCNANYFKWAEPTGKFPSDFHSRRPLFQTMDKLS